MDIVFGPFFICDSSGEEFGSLSDEQAERYLAKYLLPEKFVRTQEGINTVCYDPEEVAV